MENLKDIILEHFENSKFSILEHFENSKFSIIERLHINKDTGNNNFTLNKVFNNVEDLIEELKIYFEDKLLYKNHIPLLKQQITFSSIDPTNLKSSITVNEHFQILFKDNKFLRGGCIDNILTMQAGYYVRGARRFWQGFMIDVKDGYNFGKDNFIDWINNLDKKYDKIKKCFV